MLAPGLGKPFAKCLRGFTSRAESSQHQPQLWIKGWSGGGQDPQTFPLAANSMYTPWQGSKLMAVSCSVPFPHSPVDCSPFPITQSSSKPHPSLQQCGTQALLWQGTRMAMRTLESKGGMRWGEVIDHRIGHLVLCFAEELGSDAALGGMSPGILV